MKKRIAKLRLNRETLRALDGNRLSQVAGGKTESDCMCTDSITCQSCNASCDSDCFSCQPNCVDPFPTAGSCRC